MFDQHAKDDREEKNSSASVTINQAHLHHSITSVQQVKVPTSF